MQDRVAVVTGAGSGIGAATARLLASRGAQVFALDIDRASVHAVAELINDDGGMSSPVIVDVADAADVGIAFATIRSQHSHVDFVVNAAASFIAKGLDATTADWDKVLGVNIRGYSNIVQASLPLMLSSDAASIVNVSSISAHIAQPSRWTYNATKGAILSLSRCMAMDLAEHGIRVNVVSPGWIWTNEVARAADGDRKKWEPIWGKYHLLGRLGEAREVATAIAFLLSSESSFITGAEIPVDGGYLSMGPEGLGETAKFAGSA